MTLDFSLGVIAGFLSVALALWFFAAILGSALIGNVIEYLVRPFLSNEDPDPENKSE